MAAGTRLTGLGKNQKKAKEIRKKYLGSNLVSALAGLQVHNFAHFGQMGKRTVE